MSVHVLLDCSKSLEQQNQVLNIYQRKLRCRVVDFANTDKPQNIATFETKQSDAAVPELHLIEVPSGSNARDVQPPNTALTFEHTVCADSEITVVAGFHAA